MSSYEWHDMSSRWKTGPPRIAPPPDAGGRPRFTHRAPAGRVSATGRGFTLLEVLIALAIMAIATTLVMQLFSADLRAIARSGDVTSAAVRGDSRIREILADPALEEKTWSEETPDGYRMDIAVAEVMKPRTDSLPVRLMEVALTIRWIEGMKERSLRLKTMKMVDKVAPSGKGSPTPAQGQHNDSVGS
jgi:general secretion pathway protein I